MKSEKIGEIARRHYQAVKYFPFGNSAGSSFVLTSYPFNYLHAWLDNKINIILRDTEKKRNKLSKAKYFTTLSEDFYQSSLHAQMPAKGTLIYYSLLNLVKAQLIVSGYDLESKIEHHGLTLPPKNDTKLKLTPMKAPGTISIFHEFAKTLKHPINNSDGNGIELEDLLRELPEIHELGHALGLFQNTKRKFLPVHLTIRTNEPKNKLYFIFTFEKKNEKLMRTDKLEKDPFNKIIKPVKTNEKDLICYKSIKQINYTKNSDRSWRMAYKKITTEISKLNITPLLTRNGYRNYINLEQPRFHRLSSLLAFTFYIGTVARYRPTLNESVLKGDFQPLISEAIISCPNQFFYQLISHITDQVCAIPQAKID